MSIKKNTSYNLAGLIIPLLFAIITIPIYLELIGEARYGVLAIAWLLLGYFGVFDLGLGRATAQSIAGAKNSSLAEIASIFWSALILNLGLGCLGGMLIWPIADFFFGSVFKVEESLRPEIIKAVLWLVLAVPISTLSGVLSGALQGKEKFLTLNIISVAGNILFQVFPLVVAFTYSVELTVLLPAVLLARIITLFLLFMMCRRYVTYGKPICFNGKQARKLLYFGGWVSVSSFISPLVVLLDRSLIGAISGAQAVSHYTIPFQLAERSTVISKALSNALYPRFASTSQKESKRLAIKAIEHLLLIMTPLSSFGLLFMESFLSLWISPEFALVATLPAQIVLIGFWANSLAVISFGLVQARGRPDLTAKCHMVEFFPYVVILYFGLMMFGLPGAAFAFSLRIVADTLLLSHFARLLSWLAGIVLIPVCFLLIALLISLTTESGTIFWLLLVFGYLLIMTFWVISNTPKETTSLVISKLKQLLGIKKSDGDQTN